MFILLFICLCSDRYSATTHNLSQFFCRSSYCLKIYEVIYNFFLFLFLCFSRLWSAFTSSMLQIKYLVLFLSVNQLVFLSPFVTLLRNEIRQFIFPKFTQFLNPSINVPVSTLKSLQKQWKNAKLWLEILCIINHIKELTVSFDLSLYSMLYDDYVD